MDRKNDNGKSAVKDLPPQKSRDVKGGANATRFDPYKNFKFRVTL